MPSVFVHQFLCCPMYIAYHELAPSQGKGAMFLSDNVAVTDEVLATEFGQKLRDRGICYIRCLTDREAAPIGDGLNSLGQREGVYNHWQQSFGVETVEEVEDIAAQKGLQLEWGSATGEGGRFLRTKYYTSGFECVFVLA